ncbi:hypothetical protein ACJX0J_023061, partial [Zea mays]
DGAETEHLLAMAAGAGAGEGRLRIFRGDLLDDAARGCSGVFHLASPCTVDPVSDPQVWYPVSKTLAEKAAWRFAEENGLDVVVVNPMSVLGQIIPPTINSSMSVLLRLLQGCTEEYKDIWMGVVHVEDVALAHLLVFENPSASGRHICAESISHLSDFAAKLAELYPNNKVPKFPKDTQPGLVRAEAGVASKKLVELGLQFSPLEKIIRDAVESLKTKG